MARMILVGGGSSSGKSYLTGEVIKRVGEDEITRISIDDYYKDQADMPLAERYKVNYDHPSAFDWKLMRSQLAALKKGQAIEKPTYDFVTLTRAAKTERIEPKSLIIVEGIMALVDKTIREMGDLLVFIDASAERRFLRRMIRDHRERGRTFENIVSQYFSTVQPMYDEIVKPSSIYADLIVNNDGVQNRAVSVLSNVFSEELGKAKSGEAEPSAMSEEFSEDKLSAVFK